MWFFQVSFRTGNSCFLSILWEGFKSDHWVLRESSELIKREKVVGLRLNHLEFCFVGCSGWMMSMMMVLRESDYNQKKVVL